MKNSRYKEQSVPLGLSTQGRIPTPIHRVESLTLVDGTWCDPLDSRLGTLELSLYACMFSRVRLFVTLWTVAHKAPLSVGFSRQEHSSWLSCTPLGDLPDLGIKSRCPTFQIQVSYIAGSCSVMSNSLQPHGPYSPWNSPVQNTGVGSLSLLQGSSQPRD